MKLCPNRKLAPIPITRRPLGFSDIVLDRQLVMLTNEPAKDLLESRYKKFRNMGHTSIRLSVTRSYTLPGKTPRSTLCNLPLDVRCRSRTRGLL